MATRHASALKHHRQSERHRLRNRRNLGRAKIAARRQRQLLGKGNVEEARKNAPEAQAALDRAVAKGVLHPNAAARRKSRLQKKLNELHKAAKS